MNRPQKRKKPKKGQPLEQPVPMPLKDKPQICAWIAGFLLPVAAWFNFHTTRQQTDSLDRLVQRWRTDYHLNDDQARRIRAMEQEFHGSGDPFLRPSHTQEETREHHRAMAGVMNPDDGERFYKAQEGSALGP